MKLNKKIFFVILTTMICTSLACSLTRTTNPPSSPSVSTTSCNGTPLEILSGSENKVYQDDWVAWACKNDIQLNFHYKGSVEIARILSNPDEYLQYDVAMPANSVWSNLGDKDNILRNEQSIYTSPIVFMVEGISNTINNLGWQGNTLQLDQIVSAAENKQITFGITSATQSNSGNNMFMAILDLARKEAGYQDQPTLTSDMLQDPKVIEYVQRVLAQVDRSSSSTGFLADLFVKKYQSENKISGVFVYEFLAIESIRELADQGIPQSQLPHIFYVTDAVAESNAPMALMDHQNMTEKKQAAFQAFQTWLLSDEGQLALFEKGARVRNISTYTDAQIEKVFSPQLTGADLELVLMPASIPRDGAIIREAMNFYQSDWRRPSCTAFVVDYSGSMGFTLYDNGKETTGETQLENALSQILDQNKAAEYYLQATDQDYMVVIPFNDDTINIIEFNTLADYADQDKINQIMNLSADGGTDMYEAMQNAILRLQYECNDQQLPSIIVMTDGVSDGSFSRFEKFWTESMKNFAREVPIYSITFGKADPDQLNKVSEFTYGAVYDGTTDLWSAFAKSKGNN